MPVAGWDRAAANLSCQRLWFKAVHLYNGLDVVVAMAIYLSYLDRPNLAILVIRHVVSRFSPFLCSFGFYFCRWTGWFFLWACLWGWDSTGRRPTSDGFCSFVVAEWLAGSGGDGDGDGGTR